MAEDRPLPAPHLRRTVVDGGYCIGCGACAVVPGSAVRMDFDAHGSLRATIPDDSAPSYPPGRVCPFSDQAAGEDDLARDLFAAGARHDPRIGYWQANYAGHVAAGNYRRSGSSGGMGTWLPATLLEEGFVDAVIHVRPGEGASHFAYAISDQPAELRQGAKSRYYPVTMAEVLALVRSQPRRFAIVGIPCFVKAVRLLMREEPVFAERIAFVIGLVCGHMKTARYADFIAWQCGIRPGDAFTIDFRHKLEDRPAMDYGTSVVEKATANEVVRPMRSLFGHQWGYGLFKCDACDFCDDVMAELADVTLGDAWVSPFDRDPGGNNVVVVRNSVIGAMIENHRRRGDLVIEEVSADLVAESQAGGLRHRRAGLACRLKLTDDAGRWRPPKRVQPERGPGRLVKLQKTRMALRSLSRIAFEEALAANDFQVFTRKMTPLMRRHDYYSRPLAEHVHRAVGQALDRLPVGGRLLKSLARLLLAIIRACRTLVLPRREEVREGKSTP